SRPLLQQVEIMAHLDGLRLRGDVQLFVDVGHVLLYRVVADIQPFADVAVVVAFHEELEYLDLAGRHVEGRLLAGCVPTRLEAIRLVDQRQRLACDARTHRRVYAIVEVANVLLDDVDLLVLEQEARGPRLDGAKQQVLIVVDGQHQEPDRGLHGLGDGHGVNAFEFGHVDVHQDDVGQGLAGRLALLVKALQAAVTAMQDVDADAVAESLVERLARMEVVVDHCQIDLAHDYRVHEAPWDAEGKLPA